MKSIWKENTTTVAMQVEQLLLKYYKRKEMDNIGRNQKILRSLTILRKLKFFQCLKNLEILWLHIGNLEKHFRKAEIYDRRITNIQ